MYKIKLKTKRQHKKTALILLLTPLFLLNVGCENKPPNTYKTENTLENQVEVKTKETNKTSDINSNTTANSKAIKKEDITKETSKRKQNINPNPSKYELIDLYDVRVIDGDTVHGMDVNRNKIKVRMLGIDAPESSQPMGDASTNSLESCVFHSPEVKILVDKNNKTDKYGRYLAKVKSGVVDCNLYQVENGMAYYYRHYASSLPPEEQPVFDMAENYAKNNNVGVWSQNLVKPWDYRKDNKAN